MRFQCRNCDQIVSINDSDMGSVVSCGHCGQAEDVPSEKFAPRVVISDFVIIDQIGLGRMASVYLAHQMSLDRRVALKILSQELADDSDFIMDFFKEARAAGKLNHPNIVQAYAVDEEDGTYFLAMEHIEGKNLKQILEEQGPLPLDYCLRILHQIAEALSFIWKGHKLCHENIKPENILITKNNAAKLSDLGLSKANRRRETSTSYISPEKILGSNADIRADLYSLGITFYEILSGYRPFEADSDEEIRNMHLKTPPPDITKLRQDVPDSYVRILDKILAKHPDDRYQSPDELINDIRLARTAKSAKAARESALKAQQRKDAESHNILKMKRLTTYLLLSLSINIALMLIILMIITGKTPVKVKEAPKVSEQISQFSDLAIKISSLPTSPELRTILLDDINLFIKQFPESPHMPALTYWKETLEEFIISSKRFEMRQKQLADQKNAKDIQNLIEDNKKKKDKKKKRQ